LIKNHRSRPTSAPLELGLDAVMAAAWLYYHDGLNQADVAEIIGVSRASVVNYLQEARDRGIVRVVLAPEREAPIDLAYSLREKYRLTGCLVIPDDGGRTDASWRIGSAGGRVLSSTLTPGDIIGVAWGRTLLALSQTIPETSAVNDLSVVQIAGSMLATYELSPELCTSNIAARIGARCVNLHAPALISRPEVRDLILREPAICEQLRIIHACNRVVFSVAGVEAGSTLLHSGLVNAAEMKSYVKHAAVGVVAGRFIDADGEPVSGFLDERFIGIGLPELKRIPDRLCVAGGPQKTRILRAALVGGYVTTLVTDERTGRALMNEPKVKKLTTQRSAGTKSSKAKRS
jgi:DNA-binding transcriptional regulator LsrR (DeoR family)